MGLSGWLRRQAAAMAIALSSVEKNALGQSGESLETGSNKHQRINQGRLSDDLLRGQLTQQVRDLRWRTYKVVKEAENWKTNQIPHFKDNIESIPIYDEEGNITDYEEAAITGYTTEQFYVGNDTRNKALKNIVVDEEDDYEVELVLKNTPITNSTFAKLNDENLEVFDKPKIAEDGESATHGVIKHEDMHLSDNDNKPVMVEREFRPRIEIERFTKKLVVRKIDGDKKLLEFYISKYPSEYDNRTKLVVAECKKILNKGWRSDLVDIDKVGFVTYKAIGVPDFLEYQYEIEKFDKVIEFDGNYVFKFEAKVIVDGKDTLAEYVEDDLEERYKNKEAK